MGKFNIETLVDSVKNNLVNCVANNQDLIPAVFFITDNKIIIGLIQLMEKKYEIYKKIGSTMYQLGCKEIVLLNDCAIKCFDKNVPIDYTEMPLTYPESMRTDAVVLFHIKFDDHDECKIIPYKKNGNKVEFLDNIESTEIKKLSGIPLEGMIRDSVVEGFIMNAIIDFTDKGKNIKEIINIYPNISGKMNHIIHQT